LSNFSDYFILGIDPGTASTGFALLKCEPELEMVESGCIRTSASKGMVERLQQIYQAVRNIINKYHPREIAIEEVFFNQNVKTALSVGQARGVIMLATAGKGGTVYHYTPLEIKQAICSYGRADKKQVQSMVKPLLNLSSIPTSDDVADAMAVALCHYYSRKIKILVSSLPPSFPKS